MTATPQVSVVIPAWDAYAGAELARTVRSVRDQDVPLEILLVDNASVQPVYELEGAKLLRLARRVSVGAARNSGLDGVRTEWVVFWDADDLMLPGVIRALLTRANAAPRPTAVVARIVDGATGGDYRWPRRWMRALARVPWLFAWTHAIWALFPTTGATLLSARVAREAGGFADTDGGDDWALGVSVAFRGRVAFIDFPGRWYSRSPHSLSARWRTRPHLTGNARAARDRLRLDRGIPRHARSAWPLVAVAQLLIIFLVRPLLGRTRNGPTAAARPAAVENGPAEALPKSERYARSLET